jgi:ribonuclease VapC
VIVVDTSALVAILLKESGGPACRDAIDGADDLLLSSGTVAEALIVALRRGFEPEMAALLEGLGAEIAPVTEANAKQVAAAFARWGKGLHPAGLNFGDCFAYQLARERDCPLLFVGGDFSRTDVKRAI